jgi:uncharacterized membrane protein
MTSPPAQNTAEARVKITRPLSDVFAFYADFRNLPRFLGDVMAVELKGGGSSRWTIQGPFGIQKQWTIRVTEERVNELIRYETSSLPVLRARWDVYFSSSEGGGQTEVHEVLTAPLGQLGRAALAMIGKYPAQEVAANLHRFKELLESGRVTDTSYAVAGKFPGTESQSS